MGKLRFVSKVKQMDSGLYQELLETLKQAIGLAKDSHLFYDLEKNERGAQVKKDLLYVAEKENIALNVNYNRKNHSLKLIFGDAGSPSKARISANEARDLILNSLGAQPKTRGEILDETGISMSAWNLRINELLKDGKAVRTGSRRNATYTLA